MNWYLDWCAADPNLEMVRVSDEREFMPANRHSFMKAKIVSGKSMGGGMGGGDEGGPGGGAGGDREDDKFGGNQSESGGMNNGSQGRFKSATSQKHGARKQSQWKSSGKRSMNQGAFKESFRGNDSKFRNPSDVVADLEKLSRWAKSIKSPTPEDKAQYKSQFKALHKELKEAQSGYRPPDPEVERIKSMLKPRKMKFVKPLPPVDPARNEQRKRRIYNSVRHKLYGSLPERDARKMIEGHFPGWDRGDHRWNEGILDSIERHWKDYLD